MDVSEECQKIRSCYLCSCGTIVHHTLGDLLNAFLRLSLVCQRPAAQDTTHCPPMWEALFCSEVDGGFGAFLGAMRLATELMEYGSHNQGKTQAKRVCTLLCQGQRFVDPRQPLLSIAEEPQCRS